MTIAIVPTTRLNFTVAITPSAASSLGSSTTLPCAFYLSDSPIGFQWQVAYQQISGTWQLMTTGTQSGVIYDDGEVPNLCVEINSMGLVAWIMRQAAWFNAAMVWFFTGKVAGSTPTPPSGDVTPINFHASVNGTLASMGARDTNGDGIPELTMA